jgi:hypothetical protein
VVPCFVLEKVGPIEAIKTSAGMIKQTWGERLALGFGLGTATGLLMLASILPFGLATALFIAGVYWLGACFILLGLVYVAAVGVASASMNTIFQTALFIYCRTGAMPLGFQAASMEGAFQQKPARTVFGRTF